MGIVKANRRRRSRPALLLAGFACLMLVAASCGSDEDPADETEEATDEPDDAEEDDAADDAGDDATAEDLEELSLVVGGSGTGGGAYIAGGTVAEWVNQAEDLPNIDMTNQSTAGFVENIRLLSTGEIDLGMVSTNLLHNANEGIKAFEGEDPPENIRVIFPLWTQFAVAGTFAEDIQTMSDLEGRPVNVGPGGSATQEAARGLLGGADLIDSVDLDQQDWAEGVRLMQDGLVDAMFIMGPAPFPAIQEAAATPGEDFRLLDTSDVAAAAIEGAPEFIPVTLPADEHGEGLPAEDQETIGAQAFMAVTDQLSDEAVYALMESLLSDEGQAYLNNGYAGFRFANLEGDMIPPLESLQEVGVTVSMHPGAIQWYEDQGFTVPDSLRP